MINKSAAEFARLIRISHSTVALSGAGCSTDAGLADFRGPGGLYDSGRYDPQKIFDIDEFLKEPAYFYDFAREFIQKLKNTKPTFTHYFFSELEKKRKLKGIITQNIDALHHKAGSKNVVELHGSFWTSRCMACSRKYSYAEMEPKILSAEVPRCECGVVIKPDIVFYGEGVKHLGESVKLVCESDLFIIAGSSLEVYPAAALPDSAFGKIALVNKGPVNIKPEKVALNISADLDDFFRAVSSELE
ncbi:MAG: Sir2 family NAD-dependent protein deacetylase [Elusimicrobiota bacterium]|nr:Sir2 family NAD-dependent protein deacetylase [Elusimicrobiota bacterium]